MVASREPFPIVVTTNGGHPLDQNPTLSVSAVSAGSCASWARPESLLTRT
jgi:hypothetical protein